MQLYRDKVADLVFFLLYCMYFVIVVTCLLIVFFFYDTLDRPTRMQTHCA